MNLQKYLHNIAQGLGQLTLVNNNQQSVLFHVGQVWRHAPRLGHAPYMETHSRCSALYLVRTVLSYN